MAGEKITGDDAGGTIQRISAAVQRMSDALIKVKENASEMDELISRKMVLQTAIPDKFAEAAPFLSSEEKKYFRDEYARIFREVDSILRKQNKAVPDSLTESIKIFQALLELIKDQEDPDEEAVTGICAESERIAAAAEKQSTLATLQVWKNDLEVFLAEQRETLKKSIREFAEKNGRTLPTSFFD